MVGRLPGCKTAVSHEHAVHISTGGGRIEGALMAEGRSREAAAKFLRGKPMRSQLGPPASKMGRGPIRAARFRPKADIPAGASTNKNLSINRQAASQHCHPPLDGQR
jgi:hypothetical protein